MSEIAIGIQRLFLMTNRKQQQQQQQPQRKHKHNEKTL